MEQKSTTVERESMLSTAAFIGFAQLQLQSVTSAHLCNSAFSFNQFQYLTLCLNMIAPFMNC